MESAGLSVLEAAAAPHREGLPAGEASSRQRVDTAGSLRDTVVPPGCPLSLHICAAPWGLAASYTILYSPFRYPLWLPMVTLLKLILLMLPPSPPSSFLLALLVSLTSHAKAHLAGKTIEQNLAFLDLGCSISTSSISSINQK